ncbi:MAG TPA: hypothetical protein VLR71_16775 [Casimicrobiaceae bacterium]|nr:hypothetical protein [Casimicrobiaceae bacterium]
MFSTVIPKEHDFGALSVAVWRQTGRFVAVWIAVLSLASCAVSPIGDEKAGATSPEARREAVASRVKARWDALIKGDLQGSYGYLSPASRESTTFEQYQKVTRKKGFRDARIESIDCDAEACKVKVWVTYDHKLMNGISTPFDETWVFDKGQAWYVYRG